MKAGEELETDGMLNTLEGTEPPSFGERDCQGDGSEGIDRRQEDKVVKKGEYSLGLSTSFQEPEGWISS